ncbi:MerR family transcriptional regulator [Alkalibacter mobilis]|uniref:MerR family transcriptional regulator n=1 Tax=Alkalibacter mobilis TaxID=2787712 RepID=UPI00189CA370|nr:MerR family transcriptional regulator [Alkalibacter mobilis]MBF7097376.1 MerR family transcriptional regulator [Alkalibacter mobilis]
MEYTINKLAKIAGVSTRTLRYYDEIDLLKPSRINSSGYRIYGSKEVDLLQQILFYRSIDMKLDEIYRIITSKDFDIMDSLIQHRNNLLDKRDQIDVLIDTIEKTIANNKGEIIMKDIEKFEGLKKQKLDENENKYGKEIRQKYGEKTIEESNKKFMKLTEEDFSNMGKIEKEMIELLSQVLISEDLDSDEAKKVYEKHKAWLMFSWGTYTPQAHAGLAEMYVFDERFAKYYNDKAGDKAAGTLRDIIIKYAI